MHIDFLKDQPNVARSGPDWMFDLDFLTNTINYIPVSVENQVNVDAGTQENNVAGSSKKEKEPTQEYILLPIHPQRPKILVENVLREAEQALQDEFERMIAQEMVAQAVNDATRQAFEEAKRNAAKATSINKLNNGRPFVSTANTPSVSAANTLIGANTGGKTLVYLGGQIPIDASTLPNADLPIDPNMPELEDDTDVITSTGIFSGAFNDEDVGDPKSVVQTRGKIQKASTVQQALFKLQQVWILVDLPFGKKQIGTKWVFRNKRDEKSIVVKNKARLLAQDHRQEKGIDYDKVLAPVARIEAIRLFLAFASFMGFLVYQMDVKSAFLYGTIEEEVYVHQPPGFVDPAHPNKVYKVKQQPDGIFISQDKYVADILKKFDFCSIKTATTPIESNKPLVKDEDGVEVDVHEYRSMIGSLVYLTASRPNIMFVACACARFQVTPKASHLHVVKRIFRYLKHQPKLELWYPRDSPFELEAFSDSDYAGASLDRKSTTDGCQFLGRRLISWQCKKQTIVANSTTKAEYVAVAHCCGQVLWIQNQMMDYGFNFMNTKIYIDNESIICVVKNPVYHSRTKHIEIRHHFIRDCYEKRLIDIIKIHTDSNVADLLTKGFDVTRFNFLVTNFFRISMDLRIDRSCAGNSPHMVYKHNMVAFLKKPNESVGFTEVVDFLKGTSLRYALTHNPTIYDSLVKQFWQTITVRTLANGNQQIIASIDNKEYIVTEASIRSKLQLADATAEPHHTPVDPLPSTSQLPHPSPPHPSPPHQSSPHSPPHSIPHSPLHSPPYSPPHYSPPRSYEAPLPEGNTSGSAEASMQLKELMVLKVKTLEVALKRKSKKVSMSESEGEEPEDQGRIIQDIDDDPLVSLVRESMKEKLTDFVLAKQSRLIRTIYKRRAKSMAKNINTGLDAEVKINTDREEINTGIEEVNTGSTKVDTGRTPATHKTKEQIRQEEAGLEEAIRLQAQMDEEVAKQIHLDEMVAKRVQEELELSEQQLKRKDEKLYFKELKTEFEKLMKSIKSFVPMETEARVKRQGVQLEQETLKKQKIDIKDVSITKEKDEVVKEEETDIPVKKTGKRRKQKARKGINIAKTVHDESKEEREAFVKEKVKGASLESEIGVDVIPTATNPLSIVDWKIIPQLGYVSGYKRRWF
ncbi:putative ribonuclease H-like domain-containing protein [Tanacetum coccineum]